MSHRSGATQGGSEGICFVQVEFGRILINSLCRRIGGVYPQITFHLSSVIFPGFFFSLNTALIIF